MGKKKKKMEGKRYEKSIFISPEMFFVFGNKIPKRIKSFVYLGW